MSAAPVLVCAATWAEAFACLRALHRERKRFEVLRTGMGPGAAKAALEKRLRSKRALPRKIISTGFAGSLSSALPTGDWVAATEIRSEDGRTAACEAMPDIFEFQKCPFVSVARFRDFPDAVRAVDMESFALAEVAAANGIPFSALRLLSDDPHNRIPEAIREFSSVALETNTAGRGRLVVSGAWKLFRTPAECARFLRRMRKLDLALGAGWKKISAGSF